MRAATSQPGVRRRLTEVLHLLRPASALFGPGMIAGVARDWFTGQPGAGCWRAAPPEEEIRSRLPRRPAADLEGSGV
jgi:hypothetical protein